MRSWRVTAMTILGCLLITGAAVAASDGPDATKPPDRRAEVVSLVLAQDVRFAGLPDYERQQIRQASQFSFDPIVGSSYYRVLPTATTQWTFAGTVDAFAFRQPRNWLVEVVLVRDCVPLSEGESAPVPDPCAWRHAWYYRVQPDDTVTLLFEEGDPDS